MLYFQITDELLTCLGLEDITYFCRALETNLASHDCSLESCFMLYYLYTQKSSFQTNIQNMLQSIDARYVCTFQWNLPFVCTENVNF